MFPEDETFTPYGSLLSKVQSRPSFPPREGEAVQTRGVRRREGRGGVHTRETRTAETREEAELRTSHVERFAGTSFVSRLYGEGPLPPGFQDRRG